MHTSTGGLFSHKDGHAWAAAPRLGADPAVLNSLQSRLGRLQSVEEAERVAADLPAVLGPAFEQAPGVPELRALIANYVQRRTLAANKPGSVTLETLTKGEEWESFQRACVEAIASAQRTGAHPPPATVTEETNVLSFDPEEGNHFQELRSAGAIRMDEFDTVLVDEEGGVGLCSHGSEESESPAEPSMHLVQCVRAYAQQQRSRLARPSSVLAYMTAGTSIASTNAGADAPLLDVSAPREPVQSTRKFLSHIADLLQRNPDVVWQCSEWGLLVRLLPLTLVEEPEAALDVAERYFTGAGSRQRFLLLYEVVQAVMAGITPNKAEDGNAMSARTLGLVHRFAQELPADWVTLMDREIECLLLCLLRGVVLPHAALLSVLDPQALWLQRWCERATFGAIASAVFTEAPELPRHLQAALPHREELVEAAAHAHVVCVVTYMLSCLPSSAWDTATSGETLHVLAEDLLRLFSRADLSPEMMERVDARITDSTPLIAPRLPLRVRQLLLRESVVTATAAAECAAETPGEDSHRRLEWHLRVVRGLLHRGPGDPSAAAWEEALVNDEDDDDDDCTGAAMRKAFTSLFIATEDAHRSATVSEAQWKRLAALCGTFWADVLPAHSALCGGPMEAIIQSIATPTCSDAADTAANAYKLSLLVATSASLNGWLKMRSVLSAKTSDVNYDLVLDAILSPSSYGNELFPALSARACVLLTRWCTVRKARDGLRKALQRKLTVLLRSGDASAFYDADDVATSPLLIPAELLDGVDAGPGCFLSDDTFSPVAIELPVTRRRELRSAALCQQAGLLLGIAHLPVSTGDNPLRDDEFIVQVLAQIERDFLSVEEADSAEKDAPQQSPSMSTSRTFGDDSLLALLAAAAMSVLVSLDAEHWLWWSPPDSLARLRRLRGLCAARRGVDPIYFLVRFLTSGGKGRHRLMPILAHGFAAELQVDTTIPVEAFVEGEAYPRLPVAALQTPRGGGAGRSDGADPLEIVKAAFGDGFSVSQGAALTRVVAALRLVNPTAAVADLVTSLQRQSLNDWCAFEDAGSRAECVARLVLREEQEPEAAPVSALLTDAGVDLYFLVYVCVSSWMWSPPLKAPTGSVGGGLLRSSLKEFMKRGLHAWDTLVARSLTHFLLATVQDARELSGSTAQRLPPSSAFPVPSTLFVALLVRPFTLEKPKPNHSPSEFQEGK